MPLMLRCLPPGVCCLCMIESRLDVDDLALKILRKLDQGEEMTSVALARAVGSEPSATDSASGQPLQHEVAIGLRRMASLDPPLVSRIPADLA
jgi:hypothetical protein